MSEIKKYDANVLNTIGKDGDLLSLTDLWKIAGSPDNKRPIDWKEKDSTKELIETMAYTFSSATTALLKTKRGRNAGTYGHKSIALSYATRTSYISQ